MFPFDVFPRWGNPGHPWLHPGCTPLLRMCREQEFPSERHRTVLVVSFRHTVFLQLCIQTSKPLVRLLKVGFDVSLGLTVGHVDERVA